MLEARSGSLAVEVAKKTRAMKESLIADSDGYGLAARQVAGRTFYLSGGVWTDSEFDEKAEVKEIAYGSEAYFGLLTKGGDIGKYLALGTQVIFQFDGTWYRIVENDKASD